jgi:hypothetical protein
MTEHPLARDHTIGAYTVTCEAVEGEDRLDWYVEADLSDPETGRTERFTASLVCATYNGTFSHPWEREIPDSVLSKIEALADRLADAGLF